MSFQTLTKIDEQVVCLISDILMNEEIFRKILDILKICNSNSYSYEYLLIDSVYDGTLYSLIYVDEFWNDIMFILIHSYMFYNELKDAIAHKKEVWITIVDTKIIMDIEHYISSYIIKEWNHSLLKESVRQNVVALSEFHVK